MPEQITISIPAILAFCGLVVAIGGAVTYIHKLLKPLKKPYEEIQNEFDDIEQRSAACAKKFQRDEARLDKHEKLLQELFEDNKFMLQSVALLLQHAETGNSTGAITKGRKDLETYLIQRRNF